MGPDLSFKKTPLATVALFSVPEVGLAKLHHTLGQVPLLGVPLPPPYVTMFQANAYFWDSHVYFPRGLF